MSTRPWRPRGRSRRSSGSGTELALSCARNVYALTNRKMPEAAALVDWLFQHARAFGLPEEGIPDLVGPSRVQGVNATDWARIGKALGQAVSGKPGGGDAVSQRWIAAVGAQLGLDELETHILSLTVHYQLDNQVERLFDKLSESRCGAFGLRRDAGLIATLLRAEDSAVAARLAGGARLFVSGLLHFGHVDQVGVLPQLLSVIRRDVVPAADFYEQLLGAVATEPLEWDSFAHLGRDAELAADVLAAALAHRKPGINILLYGPPGTGKTSFAATLAARVGARLCGAGEVDEDRGEPTRSERLGGLRLAQRLARPGCSLLLFDEAEDLFVRRSIASDASASGSRVFMHRLLESVPVPIIWTANNIGALGPAVLRRMTMCLELRVPNLATRTMLWRRLGGEHGVVLREADAARLARLVPAAPAVAAGALKATALVGGGAETARLIVEGVARAVHGGGLPVPEPEPDIHYDPQLVNADCDLTELEADLLRPGASPAVSFLLAGPPGTGKSAWVRHVAGRMGLPVLQKRASDLLNPFVGGTELNIARAFAEARDAGGFLVFDEADSMLLERADAVRSWEIAQVNEMLTWMETHPLPFACTTNMAERLDRASLRRFLVKLRFDWPSAAQVRLAFRHFFGQPAPAELDGLRTLTPADFALVQRRVALRRAPPTAPELVRLLEAECAERVGGRLPIGFAGGAAG